MASMLVYKDWMKATKRGPLTPRSKELEAIDAAIKKYGQTKQAGQIAEIQKALAGWKTKKGANWKKSTRNSDGAVELLEQEIAAKMPGVIARGAAKAQLRPTAPAPPYPTMTDDNLVSKYVEHVKTCFRKHWDAGKPVATGAKLLEGISSVHQSCGIPDVGIEIKNLPDGYNGFFNFSKWTIEIAQGKFQYPMVYDPPSSSKPHAWFINVAETLYHEGRHCEQWWHMARYCAHGADAHHVAAQLGIPQSIAMEAKKKPMKHGDPLIDQTEAWFKSVYGGSNRGIVLHALGLKRAAHPSPKVTPQEKGGGEIHGQYKGNLAEEVDAWAIQDLVRAKF